jgi:hypothetical protein
LALKLVRAFLHMTNELHRRDRQLKPQAQSLRIEVDRIFTGNKSWVRT